jgi:hypothetical protein
MSAKDYLWEKKGEGDAETRELENLLGQARFSGMEIPAEAQMPRRKRWPLGLVVLAAAAVAVFVMVPREGFIRVDGTKLYAEQWFETGTGESARMQLGGSIGHVDVAEGSRVRVVRVDQQQQRLELERGRVHAVVLAPPRLFVIDTPSATAVDLGCEYELTVDAAGASRLNVLSGLVELEAQGQRAIVLAGMWSVTKQGAAPSVPVDRRATPALISALERLPQDASVLPLLLSQADTSDAATLWHLLSRTEGETRRAVYARLQELSPAQVDEAAVLRLDSVALESWWATVVAARRG